MIETTFNLKRARKKLGLTQEGLAEYLNEKLSKKYDGSTISRWENNREKMPQAVQLFLQDVKMNAQVIAVANQKGGVAKTTSTVTLACITAKRGFRTLIIDCDAQSNVAHSMNIVDLAMSQESRTIEALLDKDAPAEDISNATIQPYMDEDLPLFVIPCSLRLQDIEWSMRMRPSWEQSLNRLISRIRDQYDFIFLDCPPALGFMTQNAFAASDYVLIPCATEPFGISGIEQLMEKVNEYRTNINYNLKVLGILPTRYKKSNKQDVKCLSDIHGLFGPDPDHPEAGGINIYKEIPERTDYMQALHTGRPLYLQQPYTDGMTTYTDIAKELIELAGLKG